MLRALQVSHSDIHGSRFTGFDHTDSYKRCGVNLDFCVFDQQSPRSYRLGSGIFSIFRHLPLKKIEHALSIQSLIYPYSRELERTEVFRSADVVHYHLIHTGYFSLLSLPRLSRLKPSLWTWHDPWPMTGHCIHPYDCVKWQQGCNDCPDLGRSMRMRRDHASLMWKIKKGLYARSRLDVVVASRWMRDLLENSPFSKLFSTHLIPFGVDLEVFRPMDAVRVKSRLGIDPDAFVICFRATTQPAKGFSLILNALRELKASRPICLLTFDKTGLLDEFTGRYRVVELGWVSDAEIMAEAFAASDLFLMPSTAEAFGMMAVEAMACGTPVVVCEGTALTDIVCAPTGGLAVPQNDSARLAGEISRLIADETERQRMGEGARAIARDNYDLADQVRRMSELYQDVVARWAAESARNPHVDEFRNT